MAKFNMDLIKKYEGEYSNHLADTGGETYIGIARNYHPKWAGWIIIDNYKMKFKGMKRTQLLRALRNHSQLQALVYSFYKAMFWDAIQGDRIDSQIVADNIVDFAINAGIKRSVRFMQNIIKVPADGIVGPVTLKQLNNFSRQEFVEAFLNRRALYYTRLTNLKPQYKVFLKGWMNRVNSLRDQARMENYD